MTRRISVALAIGTALSTAPSAMSETLNFRAHLNGREVVPDARDTLAQGQAVFQLSPDGTELAYLVIGSNIENVTGVHIHRGAEGVTGPLVALLYGPAPAAGGRTDGVLAGGTLTAANLRGPLLGHPLSDLIDLIQSGAAYVDIATNDGVLPANTGPGDFFNGEVRGQIR